MGERKLKSIRGGLIYVIAGKDKSLVSAECERVIDWLLEPGEKMTGLFAADGEEATISEVLDELRTVPFLADKRVVVIRDAENFISANRQLLEDYFDKPCSTGVLILTVEKWPPNTRLAKKLAGCGKLIVVTEPKGKGLQSRLIEYARQGHGKKLSRQGAELMIELVGDELCRLYVEIDKLALLSEGRQEITIEDIELLTGHNRLFNAFEVIDSCLLGRAEEAVGRLREMFEADRSAEYTVIGAFAYHIRRMFVARRLLEKGLRINEIAGRLKIWSNKESFFSQVHKVTLKQIGSLLERLAQIDYAIKTGRTKARVAVEQLVLRLAGGLL